MNAEEIVNMHILHLRDVLLSTPDSPLTQGLLNRINGLIDDVDFIHPNVTMRQRRIVRPNAMELNPSLIETEQIQQEQRERACFRCPRKISSKYTEARLNTSSEMDCAICYEVPTLKNVCVTSCGHSFCNSCFDHWEENCIIVRNTTCPSCRAEKPKVTSYQPRKHNV